MKFLHTTLYVSDVEASLGFYRDIVGLPLQRRFSSDPGRELAFLGEGETLVELIQDPDKPRPELGCDISLGFAAGDAEALRQSLIERGLPGVTPMIEPGPGVRFFFVQDPDGARIQFMQS